MLETNKKNNTKGGFTLIELMVVISIISLLSSIIFSSINTARMNARDAKRISDVRQIRIALELYRNQNGTYPVSGFIRSTDPTWDTTSALQTALTTHMPKIPKDPVNAPDSDPWFTGNYTYAYYYSPVSSPQAKSYDLTVQLENTSSPLRASVKNWVFHLFDGTANNTYVGNGYSPYVYTGEY